ncbi:uncharacterized protein LOC141668476 isoform X2 [Apium graveolens]|uniref:uncharacterized protein LOC141668476 isoform X2 n=1 Tax=Apium graveolens TaxID=4045 RepID=UPI003D7AFFD7
MGENEDWVQPTGIFPNGMLPNAGPLIHLLESDRWLKAEDRTADLISRIQPNQPSEQRRNAVADYVQRLIMKCFPCQVFTFGSVPLKTYLPDGDIDLTTFTNNQNLKETWATQVRDMLESEEKDENAEFRVKEVQYIQAEVKIIKCLVENIVVDISFNQVGGLCTLCFLEEVDHLIDQNHLFKRSIILIKAWCYYESRILGAHHGLISTYALETLVLYIFHVFNNSFAGPLEVLYRFLEFFSNFDWDNFCVSLWGPVSISSLPDVTAETPRKDGGELLLSKLFLDACSSVYAVIPAGQENQGQPFVSKYFNVIDPLRVNNNLGRSVNKGNFYRIRSAFALGAKKMARLLDCPDESIISELNQFFMNTWERHGSGVRPDAPEVSTLSSRSSIPGNVPSSVNSKDRSSGKKVKSSSSVRDSKVERTSSHGVSSQRGNISSDSMSGASDVSETSRGESQKRQGNLNSKRISNQIIKISSNQATSTDKVQRNLQSQHLLNDIQGRFLFARTRSSPELTDNYGDLYTQGRQARVPDNSKTQGAAIESSTYLNSYHRNRKNPEPDLVPSHSGQSVNDDPSSVRHATSRQAPDPDDCLNSAPNSHQTDSGSRDMTEEPPSAVGMHAMHQEEQDIVNMMASSTINGFNGQVHVPLNLAAGQLPFPVPPSVLASMGYAQRNFAGMVPANFPLIDHSFSNMQFAHGFVPPQLSHYFSGIRFPTNIGDPNDPSNENIGSTDMKLGETDHDYWQERDMGSTGGFDSDLGNVEMLHTDDKPQSTSSIANFFPSSRSRGPGSGRGSSTKGQHQYSKEKHGSMQDDHLDSFQIEQNRENEVYSDERTTSSRFSSAAHSSSIRSKTSSESSWEEPSSKVIKSTREKRGKKIVSESSTMYGKGKIMSEHVSDQPEENNQDRNRQTITSNEIAERSSEMQAVPSLHMVRHHMPDYESAQTSGSEAMIPMPPMIFGSRQRMMDNSGAVPFAFYPTGPPVPFLTMLPVYNVPPDAGATSASSHYGVEEVIENSDSAKKFDITEEHDQTGNPTNVDSLQRIADNDTSLEQKSDILNSDFASHWQNLQFGRFCQNPRSPSPLAYPSPVMVPPMYLQGRVQWDGPGRPLSGNMNGFTQLMNYGPRLVPVSPIQPVSGRPPNVYQRYGEDIPRYRSGTGTYLPNPVSGRDRHSSGTRRGNYSYDRTENNGDREGNWNVSKSRATGRNHNRNQSDRSNSKIYRPAGASESRPDRSWNSYRHDTFPSYQSQNGPLYPNSPQAGLPNVTYGMYSVPAVNSSGLSSNGPTAQSLVMLYPYDHNPNYGPTAEQVEFGSLGQVGFSGMNEQYSSEASRETEAFDEHRLQGRSAHHSSPDQPSSPHHYRRI